MKNNNISDRLRRIDRLMAGDSSRVPQSNVSARYQKMADAMGGRLVTDQAGCYCLVKHLYQYDFVLGNERLRPADPSATVASSSFSVAEREGEVPLGNLLFFDTETTGLGGAGAVPFLVGCGSLTPAGFEVRQYLLPDYPDEAAMLEQVLTEFGRDKTLVSYNGIAFDMNLLRDRMIVNRVARELPYADHFDLLHSTRRLWRRRLADCTLTNIERELFGFCRDDDIPGHLIPSVYFDWLQTDALEFMGAVLEHNRFDILTLYFLVRRIDEVFRYEGATLDSVADLYSLSRVYGRRRCYEKVMSNFRTLQRTAPKSLGNDVLFFHSLAFKRSGDWSHAVDLWLRLADSGGREGFFACLELAKYFEHRAKDIPRALGYAQKARQSGPLSSRQNDLLRFRIVRLQRKKRR